MLTLARSCQRFANPSSWYCLGQTAQYSAICSLSGWQRRCDRLEGLLRRVKCPRLEEFEVDGTTYRLPVRMAAPAMQPSNTELEYLRGFFDGDGCVTMFMRDGCIRLMVSQALDGAGVLVRFRQMLGGGIYRERDATGLHQASLKWQASSTTGIQAAGLLSSLPSMKQAQLNVAVQGPIPTQLRAGVASNLTLLKQCDHTPSAVLACSWSYAAGFFDAEGSISVRATDAHLCLSLSQVNPYILKILHAFLRSQGFNRWVLCEGTHRWDLRCTHFSQAVQFLDKLLSHGLMRKRRQAELSMALTLQNHHEIREAVSNLNGNQGVYRRLDEAGAARAKEIKQIQGLLRRRRTALKPNQAVIAEMDAKLQGLQEEHAKQNLISRCYKLRIQLRRLLSQGATIGPLIMRA
ncbi:unnamed protein product [Durusdinium trenchii]|uniref:LAGLIDADG endonuclease n=1 Tax=Durusdinium trenchii TaxID=1381693 RepID=A0ABP0R018_9DINO